MSETRKDDAKTEVGAWTQTQEGMREFQQEMLIINVTEQITAIMKRDGLTRKELAERLGVSRGRVSQMLDGGANLTLRRVADIFAALGCMMTVGARPLVAEEEPMAFIQLCTAGRWQQPSHWRLPSDDNAETLDQLAG